MDAAAEVDRTRPPGSGRKASGRSLASRLSNIESGPPVRPAGPPPADRVRLSMLPRGCSDSHRQVGQEDIRPGPWPIACGYLDGLLYGLQGLFPPTEVV